MATNARLPKREAKVQIGNMKDPSNTWIDSIAYDPIMLPVDSSGMADVFDAGLMNLTDTLLDDDFGSPDITWRLVWSLDGEPVRGMCPDCDDVFIVDSGWSEDLDNGGCAIICGCRDDR